MAKNEGAAAARGAQAGRGGTSPEPAALPPSTLIASKNSGSLRTWQAPRSAGNHCRWQGRAGARQSAQGERRRRHQGGSGSSVPACSSSGGSVQSQRKSKHAVAVAARAASGGAAPHSRRSCSSNTATPVRTHKKVVPPARAVPIRVLVTNVVDHKPHVLLTSAHIACRESTAQAVQPTGRVGGRVRRTSHAVCTEPATSCTAAAAAAAGLPGVLASLTRVGESHGGDVEEVCLGWVLGAHAAQQELLQKLRDGRGDPAAGGSLGMPDVVCCCVVHAEHGICPCQQLGACQNHTHTHPLAFRPLQPPSPTPPPCACWYAT